MVAAAVTTNPLNRPRTLAALVIGGLPAYGRRERSSQARFPRREESRARGATGLATSGVPPRLFHPPSVISSPPGQRQGTESPDLGPDPVSTRLRLAASSRPDAS